MWGAQNNEPTHTYINVSFRINVLITKCSPRSSWETVPQILRFLLKAFSLNSMDGWLWRHPLTLTAVVNLATVFPERIVCNYWKQNARNINSSKMMCASKFLSMKPQLMTWSQMIHSSSSFSQWLSLLHTLLCNVPRY